MSRKGTKHPAAAMRAVLDRLGKQLVDSSREREVGVGVMVVHYLAKDDTGVVRPCLHVFTNEHLLRLSKSDATVLPDLLSDFAELPERLVGAFRIASNAMNDRPCARSIPSTTLAWGLPSGEVH